MSTTNPAIADVMLAFAEGIRPTSPPGSHITRYYLREALDAAGTLEGLGRMLSSDELPLDATHKGTLAAAVKHVANGLAHRLEHIEGHIK